MVSKEDLTEEQLDAISKIVKWYSEVSSDDSILKEHPYFLVFGYAGTGKTTLVEHIVEELDVEAIYTAYTGIASSKNSFIMKSQTLHKLLYTVKECVDEKGKKYIKFEPRKYLVESPDLIVVDEFSMVPDEMIKLLLSHEIPVLALEDPFQLPPVSGNKSYQKEPDVFLTQIHRQAQDNPLIRISMDIRNGNPIKKGFYDNKLFVIDEFQLEKEHYTDTDIVICGYNRTRKRLNQYIRKLLGYDTMFPVDGDKVIALQNNYKVFSDKEQPLINGYLGYTKNVRPYNYSDKVIRFDFVYEDSVYENVSCYLDSFFDLKKQNEGKIYVEDYTYFDYGYVITCHKAQGSEFDSVLLFNEAFGDNITMKRRWLYTAVTRAKNLLYLVV